MGVVNTTPDSFFDGGRYSSAETARARVDALVDLRTTILDIGGESTRPGSEPVSADEQIVRITPALDRARDHGALVSVDTTSAEVADFALSRGASIVNDVSCLSDRALADVAARHGAGLVIMHSRGPMSRMPGFSEWPEDGYRDVVVEVREDLAKAKAAALEHGVREDALYLDPGLGFAKSAKQSLELLRRLPELLRLGSDLVVGPSRKSFISAVAASPPEERLGGTIAACLVAVERGAKILRVHDVKDIQQALAVHRSTSASPDGGAAHAR